MLSDNSELNRLKWKSLEMARTHKRSYIVISYPREDPKPNYKLLSLDGLAIDVSKVYIEWYAGRYSDPIELKRIGVLW